MRIGTRQNNSITVGQLEPRSPIARRRTHAGKEQMPREEKVYREIMGADGKVKPQYEHWLMELDVESDDLLDK